MGIAGAAVDVVICSVYAIPKAWRELCTVVTREINSAGASAAVLAIADGCKALASESVQREQNATSNRNPGDSSERVD